MPLSTPVVFGLALVGYWVVLYCIAKLSILFYSYVQNGPG
jgi:hypothetical protein